MRVFFRVDASLDIGTGHVMRCLTLACEIVRLGGSAKFFCRDHEGHLIAHIQQQGFEVLPLPPGYQPPAGQTDIAHAHWLGATQDEDAAQCKAALKGEKPDWLIVDHYGLDQRWERAMAEQAGNLMVIDDLADRQHACEILLDQNLGRQAADYKTLVPEHCRVLAGPSFALLRPEFAHWRNASLKRRENLHGLKSLLVNLGGVDRDNVTTLVLAALQESELPADCLITVVMGSTAPGLSKVRDKAATLRWKTQVLTNVDNMAELMAGADLAIGAAGTTSWERCCLGLPTLVMVLADNQRLLADNLCKAHAASYMGTSQDGAVGLSEQLRATMEMGRLEFMSAQAAALVDGHGTSRIVEYLK